MSFLNDAAFAGAVYQLLLLSTAAFCVLIFILESVGFEDQKVLKEEMFSLLRGLIHAQIRAHTGSKDSQCVSIDFYQSSRRKTAFIQKVAIAQFPPDSLEL